MNTVADMINSLTFAEVNGNLEPDTRRMMRGEREALSAALRSGDGKKIKAAMAEAKRVADMWSVKI